MTLNEKNYFSSVISRRFSIFPETKIFHLQQKNPRELLPTFSGLQTSSSQGLFMTIRAWEGITFCVQGIQRVLATNSSVSNNQVKITLFLRLAQGQGLYLMIIVESESAGKQPSRSNT